MKILEKKGDFVIFKYNEPFINIQRINNILPEISNQEVTVNSFFVYFRWSREGLEYSEWMQLLDYDIFDNLSIYDYDKFWIDIKYELNVDCLGVYIPKLNFDITKKNIDKSYKPFNLEFSVESGSRFVPISFYEATYNPYQQTEAIRLLKELSYQTNNLYGITCKYIKANPVAESKDLFLLEWGLFNYDIPVEFKAIVPNNEFADNKFNFNPFGIDFEMPFEILIDKRYYESIFGLGKSPQKFDVVYIPMQDRLYDIESSQLVREFMQEPLYFKLSLIKHSNQTNIESNDITNEFLDDISTGIYDMFDNDMKAEQNNVTDPLQFKEETIYSNVNKKCIIESNLYVKKHQLTNNNIIISNTYYDFNDLYEQKSNIKTIEYYSKNTFVDQTLVFWVNKNTKNNISKKVRKIELLDDSLIIYFNVLPNNIKINDFLAINTLSNTIYSSKIININKANSFVTIDYDEFMMNYSNQYGNWMDEQFILDNLKAGKDSYSNIISNINNNKGISVNIYNYNILSLEINNKKYLYTVNLDNNWNAFIIQILKSFNQISVFQYNLENNNLSLKNKNMINNLIPDYNNNETYYINASPIKLTNLRLFVSPIKEEYHINILNQNIVNNSNNAIIIDNANDSINSPFIGNVK